MVNFLMVALGFLSIGAGASSLISKASGASNLPMEYFRSLELERWVGLDSVGVNLLALGFFSIGAGASAPIWNASGASSLPMEHFRSLELERWICLYSVGVTLFLSFRRSSIEGLGWKGLIVSFLIVTLGFLSVGIGFCWSFWNSSRIGVSSWPIWNAWGASSLPIEHLRSWELERVFLGTLKEIH